MPTLDELALMLDAIRRVCPATAAALSRQLLAADSDDGEVAWRIEGFYETIMAPATEPSMKGAAA